MNIFKYNYLLLFIAFAGSFSIHAMEDPNKPELPTKFETFPQFQQLPKELQSLILTISAESDNLQDAIENIRNFVLLNKEWKDKINSEQFTNTLISHLLKNKKIQNFFDQIVQNYNNLNNTQWKLTDDDKKIILLLLLGTQQAKNILKTMNPYEVTSVLWENLLTIISKELEPQDIGIENIISAISLFDKIFTAYKYLYGDNWYQQYLEIYYINNLKMRLYFLINELSKRNFPKYSSILQKYLEDISKE